MNNNFNNFPVIEANEECAICLEHTTLIYQLECNHHFHMDCLELWFREQQTCPLCRRNYGSSDQTNFTTFDNFYPYWYDNNEVQIENSNTYESRGHAEGVSTVTIGSHPEGLSTVAIGNRSYAEDASIVANGNWSHAEGVSTIAIGNRSYAEGASTVTSSNWSHAEGVSTVVNNNVWVPNNTLLNLTVTAGIPLYSI